MTKLKDRVKENRMRMQRRNEQFSLTETICWYMLEANLQWIPIEKRFGAMSWWLDVYELHISQGREHDYALQMAGQAVRMIAPGYRFNDYK